MGRIILVTMIDASPEICFDLSRSIDLHKASMKKNKEEAIGGITSGLIDVGQSVTWRAWHFFIPMKMTVRITSSKRPWSFTDEMVKGPFGKLIHHHTFKWVKGKTQMTGDFQFNSPLGWLGRIIDLLVLNRYMTRLLQRRNRFIKDAAEAIHDVKQ